MAMEIQLDAGLSSMVLQVPWFSQLGTNGDDHGSCGQACLLMMLHFYRAIPSGGRITLHDLHTIKSTYTTADDLASLAAESPFNLMLTPLTLTSVLSLRRYIDAGRPVIVLVNYALLDFELHLPAGSDLRQHWLLVVGYERDEFVLHDPLWLPLQRRGKGGAYRNVYCDTLQAALALDVQPNAVF